MKIAVIGGGPAGLRAAEIASAGGASVTLFEARASVGRKFLVAGRGGLNLTKTEPPERFAAHYSGPSQPADFWSGLIRECDQEALRAWAAGLGVETFAASTGRVYPHGLKAAPLLRRWVHRLRESGVQFSTHHRWTGLHRGPPLMLDFVVKGEPRSVETDAVILALGGGSWPDTGSDGGWIAALAGLGVAIAPLQPANCGWEVAWPPAFLSATEGQPLKNIAVRAGTMTVHGELLVTHYGLEGGALYQLSPALRAMPEPAISIDLKPDTSAERLAAFTRSSTLRLTRPRPLAEAISSAGGICWSELDDRLMLRRLPGVFAAGEMIDWEAPTGGYLIHGCFATGAHAARGALGWVRTGNGGAGEGTTK